jgi:hypothetical protein
MSDPTADTALEYIGEKAFANCERLTYFGYIENPDDPESMRVYNYLENVTVIENFAFMGCTALTNVEFGKDLEYLGTMAFAFCNALERAYIPENLLDLGGNPYAGIDASKIEVDPANGAFALETDAAGILYLKEMDTGTIYGVWGATGEYEIAGDTLYVPYAPAALAGNAITKVTIPAKMTAIPAYLFMYCTELTEVDIAEGVKTIGEYAFYGSGITSITLPTTFTYSSSSIGVNAFANCENLVNFSINTHPTAYTNAFVALDKIFAGSDKVVISTHTITNNGFHIAMSLANAGCTELHIETMAAENSVETLLATASLWRLPKEFKIYFDTTSYEDIIEFFSTFVGSTSVDTKWSFELYDANGNQLFCGTDGTIVLVTDASGNTIWQA